MHKFCVQISEHVTAIAMINFGRLLSMIEKFMKLITTICKGCLTHLIEHRTGIFLAGPSPLTNLVMNICNTVKRLHTE
jgi:hypothetical protein